MTYNKKDSYKLKITLKSLYKAWKQLRKLGVFKNIEKDIKKNYKRKISLALQVAELMAI